MGKLAEALVSQRIGREPTDGGVDAAVAPVRTYALTIGASASGGGNYAALDDGPGVFVLPRSFVELITQSHLDRSAARGAREGLTRIVLRLSAPVRTVTLLRDGDRWRTGSGAPADADRVDARARIDPTPMGKNPRRWLETPLVFTVNQRESLVVTAP